MPHRYFRAGLVVLGLAASPASAEPFLHSTNEWREYNRDWLAACPNAIDEDMDSYYGTSCFASTGSAELNDAGHPVYKLTLILNRLDGGLDIAFTAAPTDGSALDTARPLTVRFGAEPPIALDFAADLETRHNTTNQYFVTDEAKREALLEGMRARNAAFVGIPLAGHRQPRLEQISMRGVLASLDFMEAYARRVGDYDRP